MTKDSRTNPPEKTLYFLLGPTASGKSDAGVCLAQKIGAEILSLDSMQVYRGMDIGTAKLPIAERHNVEHHLLDLVEPTVEFSVAEYQREAELAMFKIHTKGKKSLFVGGTALYLKVLTHGLFEGIPMDAELRKQLNARAETEGDAVLHQELMQVDPVAGERIHVNDRKRIIRALEVYQLTGSPISELQREWSVPKAGPPRRLVGLRIPREVLHKRIEKRVHAMFDAGWVDEVKAIVAKGGFAVPSSKALGYREILQFLDGEFDLETCKAEIVKKTRVFVRRQMTWLRSFPEIAWVDLKGDESAEWVAEQAAKKMA